LFQALIVQRICADVRGKCSLWVKSTKFGGELGIDLLIEISLGPQRKIQNVRHFQDGRDNDSKFGVNIGNWLLTDIRCKPIKKIQDGGHFKLAVT
jgi:hypothetical protein